MAGNIVFCTLAGYGLAKFRFPGDRFVLLAILSTLMLPLEVTLVPTFLVIHQFGWMNTYQGIIGPLLIDAFGVFLMRQSILSIPTDYIEAARIDGAGELRILLQIIVPQCLPALAVLAIFSFRDSWDQFLWPLTVVSLDQYRTYNLGLVQFGEDYGNPPTEQMAIAVLGDHPRVRAVLGPAAPRQQGLRPQRAEVSGNSEIGADVEKITHRSGAHGCRALPRCLRPWTGGYFREHGLEPELVSCPGHPRALQALLSGEVDFINSVGAELILADLQHRGDAVVIASAISRSAQQVSARPGLTTREELRGKRWGVITRNDADECAILMAFERWGWDISRDAKIVAVGSEAPRLDALLDEKRVDVAIMHAPEPFQAAKRGWNLVEDLGRLDVAFQNSCAATTRRLIAARPLTVVNYVRAYSQAVYRFRTDPAFGITLLAKHTGEPDPKVIEQTWVLFARLMGGMMFPSLEGMRSALSVLHRLGVVPQSLTPEQFVDLAPVATLEREGFFGRFMAGLGK